MKGMMTGAIAIAVMFGVLAMPARADEEKKAEGADKDIAVLCAKCETVWVKTPRQVGPRATVLVTSKKMACDECKSAVESFFTSGKFEHTCGHCGDMVACEVAQEAAGEAPKPEGSKFVPGEDAAHSHHTVHPE